MPNTFEYYISVGFDRATAEYYASGKKNIVEVTPNDDFTLTLRFDNGEIRVYDMKPFLDRGGVFAQFRSIDEFYRVYLDEDHAVCWDIDPNLDSHVHWMNKIDIDQAGCYIDSVPVGA